MNRWSGIPKSTQLIRDDQQYEQRSYIPKTEPVKKCQRALQFVNTSEVASSKNLFNAIKSNTKELSKLHKQV